MTPANEGAGMMIYILVFFTCMSCSVPNVHEVAFFKTAHECNQKREEMKNWSTQCFNIRNIKLFEEQE